MSRKEIRDALKSEGYDSAIIENDAGTGGRKVKSYIVFGKDQLRDNSVPVRVKKYLPKLSPMSDDDASMLMENYSSNKANKLNGADTSADELVVRNIAKKNGVSKKTMDLMKKYADLTDNDTYNKAKTALNKLLTRDNKEIDALDKMSRELLRTMGIEYENDMPVVYRATTANEAGSLSYTTDKKIAEKLLKNDDSYKKVIRYVVKPNDIVIAPQFLGPLDTGADLKHIIVKKYSGEPQGSIASDFSKSKIKDGRGNLLKLYHGTDSDFSEFGDVKTEPGYWFTEDKSYALSHGKNLKTVNLDMVNPLDITTVDGDNKMLEYAKDCFGEGFSEDDILSNKFRDYLMNMGYDGMIFDHSGKNTYIAFSPEQIKILDNYN